MKKYLLALALLSLNAQAQNAQEIKISNYETQDYLVISGISKHTNNAPLVIKKWNEYNYGLGWQRSFKSELTDYRYAIEGGFFKESFGKQSAYVAGTWLHDFTQSPRLSLGIMGGLSYRVTEVKRGYTKSPPLTSYPIYGNRHLIGMAGIVAQLQIPHTSALLQTTYIPKIGSMASGVVFTQLLVKF